MEKEKISTLKAKEYNPLVLAFIGDGVHTLFVRDYVVKRHSFSAGCMHKECAKYCKASSQSIVLETIFDELSDEEKEIVLRARNAKNSHVSKNSSLIDYKKATSFEALVGYLYMTEKTDRLDYILLKSVELIK